MTRYEKSARPLVYGLADSAHLLDGERLIYTGVSTRLLVRRRAQHFEEAKAEREGRTIHTYLRTGVGSLPALQAR